MDRLEVLFWIAGAGAFGGFVDGLLYPRTYQFRVGKVTGDLGSIGDALVGATAAVAIFALAGAVFNVQVSHFARIDEFLKIVAWGVLSGFAGLKLLRPLTDKLVTEIAGKAAREAVERSSVQSREAAVHVQAGEALLTKYDFARDHAHWADQKPSELHTFLEVADNKFRAALVADPGNPDALRGHAKVLRRQAYAEKEANPDRWRELMRHAIQTLTEIVERIPDFSPGYYSRGCYYALLDDRARALADLQKAVSLNPVFRDLAKTDGDLEALKHVAEFRELIGADARPARPEAPRRPRGRREPAVAR